MMKIDLHWKLTFIFCLSAILGLLVGYAYLSGQLNSHLEKDLENELGIEPHTLVNNGDKIFEDLWLKWERYHVTNRGIPDCYFCYGTGMVYADEKGGDELKQCPECDGKGFVLDKPQR